MTLTRNILLAMGAACVLVLPAPAQSPFARLSAAGVGTMVDNERVQKELRLTDDQTTKCKAVYAKIQAKYQETFEKLRAQKQPQQILDLTKSVNQETLKAFAAVLTPAQLKRLQQIDLQQRGALAFQEPEIAKVLKLTDDQVDLIKTINADAAKEMRDSFVNPQAKLEEVGKKIGELRKETMERVNALLTEEQRKTWQEMAGPAFEFKITPPKK
jgi:Spy/CpxP family protein refolding chaperone